MSVLIVAFDGLDRELIERFGLEHVTLDRFGQIDNTTGVRDRVTDELFASFITGETWETHGVVRNYTLTHPTLNRVDRALTGRWPFERYANMRRRIFRHQPFVQCQQRRHRRQDLQVPAIFDTVADARALYVPSYNPSILDTIGCAGSKAIAYPSFDQGDVEQLLYKHFRQKKRELLDAIGDGHDLLMAHFFLPDKIHHLYPDPADDYREMYEAMDAAAAEIRDAADGVFDTVIFMSDHGRPADTFHNEQAFYAATEDLGLAHPKITDFHGLLLDRLDAVDAGADARPQQPGEVTAEEQEVVDRLEDLGYI